MTENDKARFDRFFHSDEFFQNITDMDLLLNAYECEKLYEYLQCELPERDLTNTKKYMVFAYALGKYS